MKFNQKYDHDAFCTFLRDFLPEDYTEKEKDIADLSRCKIITKAKELGHSSSLDVYVLEMSHAKETDPRVSIATDAFKLLATFGYDKALVIFKNDESENYRFSHLTISLDLNEKNKVTAKYSNARRYSFFLGEGAKTKTPEQQLVQRGRVKDTDDLLSRFSLEVVNKEFYLSIAKAFDSLVERTESSNLSLPSVSSDSLNAYKDFAVRLIGRVMFCWFLKQKKGESSQLIPDELLSLGAVSSHEGYYHSILEPLFFEVLNHHQERREIRSELFDQVPYLNGGLFSPQYDDFYELDRTTYVSRHINTLIVKDAWFKDFFGLLETYNFTIDENTVFDQELSVDPEMLGRIFENLLAEINPETGSSERKRTGSFYTPRQVVEYMADQSLQEYLIAKTGIGEEKIHALVSYDQSDDLAHPLNEGEQLRVVQAITNLRILDPACGSGAFPIGILQKVVYILQRVDPDCRHWISEKLQTVPDLWRKKIQEYYSSHPPNYIRKLDIIKNSIFGVDIQHIAVEVSRLRCFLTLVVESKIDDALPNRGIEPLPNLDFKFVCADTLVGLPIVQSNGLFDDHVGIQELKQIMSEYFSASNSKKEEAKLRFTQAQKQILSNALSAFGGTMGELTQKLTQWDPFSNKSSGWFDPKWMFGIEEGFGIVIGNPPYISSWNLDPTKKKFYETEYVTAVGHYDIYVLFYERAISLLQVNGLLCFITSNKWMAQKYGLGLRKLILRHQLMQILDFGSHRVFESATVDTQICLLKKVLEKQEYLFKVYTHHSETLPDLNSIRFSEFSTTLLREDSGLNFKIDVDQEIHTLVTKIQESGIDLADVLYVSKGAELHSTKEKIGKGEYISDAQTTPNSKKYIEGKYFERYKINEIKYLEYTPEKHKAPIFPEFFEARKLIVKNVVGRGGIQAILDESGLYNNDALINAVPYSTFEGLTYRQVRKHLTPQKIKTSNEYPLEFLLAVVNSRLATWYFTHVMSNGLHFYPSHLRKLKIPYVTQENSSVVPELVGLVKQRIASDDNGEMIVLDTNIDALVYRLFGLTLQEIKVVEGVK